MRYRASLSVFFGWCVREKLIVTNPVTGVRVPKQSAEPTEMLPFIEAELQAAYQRWAEVDARLADILLVLGWTGLRWAEARAMTVADLMEVPTPACWFAGRLRRVSGPRAPKDAALAECRSRTGFCRSSGVLLRARSRAISC